jgi:UDP-N-acetylmuramoylalanine--D-glutamate ligase
MRYDVRGKLAQFSIKHPVANGAYMRDNGDIVYSDNGNETIVMNKSVIIIPGNHNIENYCTAISAVWGLVEPKSIIKIAKTFGGVEHRIEFVREFNGVKYYNDSIATSPSRVISGLRAFGRKIIVIMGGSDKGNDLSEMVPDILKYVKLLVLNGATADKIYDTVTNFDGYENSGLKIIKTDNLESALIEAKNSATNGDIVTLCPACPAFDQFKTFEYRGRKFKELVNGFVE